MGTLSLDFKEYGIFKIIDKLGSSDQLLYIIIINILSLQYLPVTGFKRCQGCLGSKAQKVCLGARFFQKLISDQACLLKKVYLVKLTFHYDLEMK